MRDMAELTIDAQRSAQPGERGIRDGGGGQIFGRCMPETASEPAKRGRSFQWVM